MIQRFVPPGGEGEGDGAPRGNGIGVLRRAGNQTGPAVTARHGIAPAAGVHGQGGEGGRGCFPLAPHGEAQLRPGAVHQGIGQVHLVLGLINGLRRVPEGIPPGEALPRLGRADARRQRGGEDVLPVIAAGAVVFQRPVFRFVIGGHRRVARHHHRLQDDVALRHGEGKGQRSGDAGLVGVRGIHRLPGIVFPVKGGPLIQVPPGHGGGGAEAHHGSDRCPRGDGQVQGRVAAVGVDGFFHVPGGDGQRPAGVQGLGIFVFFLGKSLPQGAGREDFRRLSAGFRGFPGKDCLRQQAQAQGESQKSAQRPPPPEGWGKAVSFHQDPSSFLLRRGPQTASWVKKTTVSFSFLRYSGVVWRKRVKITPMFLFFRKDAPRPGRRAPGACCVPGRPAPAFHRWC